MRSTALGTAMSFLLLLPLVLLASDKKQESEQQSTVKFVVLKDDNGKPVRNAAVVLHPVQGGKQSKGGFELKTDGEGRTEFAGVPYGKLRIQVIAPGFQTFGEDFDIGKLEQEITIRMKRPRD